MNQATTMAFTSWVGPMIGAPAPRPSWMAPPLTPEPPAPEDAATHLTLSPEEQARLYPSLPPPRDLPPTLCEPPPPAYPDLRAEHAQLEAQLAAALEAMTHLRQRILEASEPQLVGLACAVGERIAGRELQMDPSLVVAWAREGIARLASEDSVVVAVSADIAASLDHVAWSPVASATVSVVTDPALAPASCEVRVASSAVDAGMGNRAAAVKREVQGASK